MRTQFLAATVLFLTMIASFNTYGAPGESIILNPATGDYLITYYGTGNPGDKKNKILRQVTFVPATKIEPVVESTFKLREGGEVVYRYRITSGQKSEQPLIAMRFDPITAIVGTIPLPIRDPSLDVHALEQIYVAGKVALTTPDGWGGRNFERQPGKLRISWGYENLDSSSSGLAPGKTQGGFGFSSKDIPGIGIGQLTGNSPIRGFVDQGPVGEISDQLEMLTKNDFVARNAAVPTIAVPDPFDASVTLERIQSHMHTWIDMQLLDATFSAQLDRYFQSAISSYRLNQSKVGKKQIQTMRELIKKEQPEAGREDDSDDKGDDGKIKHALIDKLAARVLDFDLKYVIGRMEGDDHERESQERKR